MAELTPEQQQRLALLKTDADKAEAANAKSPPKVTLNPKKTEFPVGLQ